MGKNNSSTFPFYGWIGILLIAVFWFLNWSLSGLRTQWGFFPLWLGYIITVDALVFKIKNTSLIKRNVKHFLAMFIISAPAWWLFEFFNQFTHNWIYDGRQFFTDTQFFLLASLSFSTVIPAVFETAELAGTFNWIKNLKKGPVIFGSNKTLLIISAAGIITLALVLVFPKYFYPLIWISVYFIIEPINVKLKNRALIRFTEKGDWRPIISLAIGCLICGFFWEMWNYYSYPKWLYNLPMVNFLHIFEMPVLGFIGYIPFSLELFALYHFVMGFFGRRGRWDYIQFIN